MTTTPRQQEPPPHPQSNYKIIASNFPRALSPARTGRKLASLEAYYLETQHKTSIVKEYAIVVVTDFSGGKRILLGMKHRGFGKGMYNSFGGKREKSESCCDCACRELQEEAGINVPCSVMETCQVGTMHYTFEDQPFEMMAHVFHVDVITRIKNENGDRRADEPFLIDGNDIRGCDEIEPTWINDWSQTPLDDMFADDSLWLTELLLAFSQTRLRLAIDGWFHFVKGGQEVNSIRHYYMNMRLKNFIERKASVNNKCPKQPSEHFSARPVAYSLEKRLFHALRSNKIQSPSPKEFNEAWAFGNAVQSFFGRKHKFDVILDVAGGHGALAACLLILTSAKRAVVIDPAKVGNNGVERAWRQEFLENKTLKYCHNDLRTGLPAELTTALQTTIRDKVLVVACHACQHLSEEVLEIVTCYFPGVHVAVMPCCQRDLSYSWKSTAKQLKIPFETFMDVLLAGKVMSWNIGDNLLRYQVRLKLMDKSITPQNRIILCQAAKHQRESKSQQQRDEAHHKLASVYATAHEIPPKHKKLRQKQRRARRDISDQIKEHRTGRDVLKAGGICLAVGFVIGYWVAHQERR